MVSEGSRLSLCPKPIIPIPNRDYNGLRRTLSLALPRPWSCSILSSPGAHGLLG